jgi:hypothetical protein
MQRVQEDNAVKLRRNGFLCLAGKLHHERHIHLCFLSQRDGQRFGCGVYAGDDYALLDGASGEHVRLADKSALVVQHFKGGQQAKRAVRIEHRLVGAGIDDAVLGGERVVKLVQPLLLVRDHLIREVLGLVLNERPYTVPNGDHALDAVLRRYCGVYRHHATVLAVVDFAVHYGIAEIAN